MCARQFYPGHDSRHEWWDHADIEDNDGHVSPFQLDTMLEFRNTHFSNETRTMKVTCKVEHFDIGPHTDRKSVV